MPELISARTNVPGLGDQFDAREPWGLANGIKESAARIEAVGLASERGREVKSEAVDVHFGNPIMERIENHLQDARMRKVERVARSRVVDSVAGLVCLQTVVRGVVDAP